MKDTRPTRPDYRTAYAGFSLAALEEELAGDLSEGINVCIEACDRHDGDAVALYWENERGDSGTVTFGELRERAARFANVLISLGVKPGDCVAGLLPRTPDLPDGGVGHVARRRGLPAAVHGLRTESHRTSLALRRHKACRNRRGQSRKARRGAGPAASSDPG